MRLAPWSSRPNGVEVEELHWRRDRTLGLASSTQLAHRVGVNGFFCSLLGAARRTEDAELRLWWPERQCRATWGDVVRPDGYGVWAEAGAEVAFFLEYDRGTETRERLVSKLDGYATMVSAAKDAFWVLLWFPGAKREAAARKALASAPVPVAAGCHGEAPAGAVWVPVGPTESRRRRLAELAATMPGPRAAR